MANLLLHWLNDDVNLSRHISSLDEDFRDGYMLGELLYKYNHQPNFSLFLSKNNADARINNFCLLEPSMRALGVKFDAKLAHDVMAGKQGATGQLLYELKMKLLRKERWAPPVSATSLDRRGVRPLPNLPERASKPAYDQVNSRAFESKIRELTDGHNKAMEGRTLRRFQLEKERQQATVLDVKNRTLTDFATLKEQERQQRLHGLMANKEAGREVDATQLDRWAANQQRAAEREDLRFRTQARAAGRKEAAREARRQAGAREVADDIGAFEGRLKEVIKTQKGGGGGGTRGTAAKSAPSTQLLSQSARPAAAAAAAAAAAGSVYDLGNGTLAAPAPEAPVAAEPPSVTQAGEHKVAVTGTGRERRRRQFAAEGEAARDRAHRARHRALLAGELGRRSAGERELDARQEWVARYKLTMAENRAYRQRQYAQRAEVDTDETYKRDQSHLDAQKVGYHLEVRAHGARHAAARAARGRATVHALGFFVDTTLRGLVDLALEAAAYRAYTGTARGQPGHRAGGWLPAAAWADLRRCYVGGLLLLAAAEEPAAARAPLPAPEGWGAANRLQVVGHEDRRRVALLGGVDPDAEAAEVAAALNREAVDAYLRGMNAMEEGLDLAAFEAEAEAAAAAAAAGGEGGLSPSGSRKALGQSESKKALGGSESKKALAGKEKKGGKNKGGSKKGGDLDEAAARIAAEEEAREAELKAKLMAEIRAKNPHLLVRLEDPRHALGELAAEASVLARPLPAPPAPPPVALFPLRLAVLGRSFAGKSQVAVRLAERYHLRVISCDELVASAAALARGGPGAALGRRGGGPGAGEAGHPLAGMVTPARGGAAAREVNARFEGRLAAVGHRVLAALNAGGCCPDDAYADLVLEELRRLAEENQALREAKERGEAVDAQPWMGWVIDDYPETREQAARLEWLLSGYDEHAHVPRRADRATLAAGPLAPTPAAELAALRPSGLDLVVLLEAPKDAVIRRCLGRRTDPATGETYHFEGRLPHYDEIVKERLLAPEDPENPTPQLPFQLCAHEAAAGDVRRFFARFGVLREVDTQGLTADGVFGKVNGIVTELVDRRAAEAAARRRAEEEAAAAAAAAEAKRLAEEEQAREMEAAAEAAAALGEGEEGSSLEGADHLSGLKPRNTASRGGHSKSRRGSIAASKSRRGSVSGGGGAAGGGRRKSLHMASSASLLSNPSLVAQLKGKGAAAVSPELAARLTRCWAAEEECYRDQLSRVFHALREQRAHVATHLHGLRRDVGALTRRPDRRQERLAKFVDQLNAVDPPMRFDARTKAELHLRLEELRHALWTEQEARRAAGQVRLNNVRTDGWQERQVTAAELAHCALLQAELDRFHAGLKLAADYHYATVGFAPEGTLEPYFDKRAKERAANAAAASGAAAGAGGKDKKGGKGGKGGGGADGDAGQAFGLGGAPRLHVPPEAPRLLQEYLEPDAGAGRYGKLLQKQEEARGKGGKKKGGGGGGGEDEAAAAAPAATLERALRHFDEHARRWGEALLPCPPDPPGEGDEAGGGGGGSWSGGGEGREPRDAPLYRAVWAMAGLARARLRAAAEMGMACVADLRRETAAVYRELEGAFEARCAAEAAAAEAAAAVLRAACEGEDPVDFAWRLEGEELVLDRTERARPPPPPAPATLVEFAHPRAPNRPQRGHLRRALERLAAAGGGLAAGDLAACCARLAADPAELLPEAWAALGPAHYRRLAELLDPEDTGEVTLEAVMGAFLDHEKTLALLSQEEEQGVKENEEEEEEEALVEASGAGVEQGAEEDDGFLGEAENDGEEKGEKK